jgi:hypothetical protein
MPERHAVRLFDLSCLICQFYFVPRRIIMQAFVSKTVLAIAVAAGIPASLAISAIDSTVYAVEPSAALVQHVAFNPATTGGEVRQQLERRQPENPSMSLPAATSERMKTVSTTTQETKDTSLNTNYPGYCAFVPTVKTDADLFRHLEALHSCQYGL